ncbi:MAG: hypothetical protein JWO80_301 [Bryobacterales bacterium]|nr:hypothetical protein [Bryobacterales bacterium]
MAGRAPNDAHRFGIHGLGAVVLVGLEAGGREGQLKAMQVFRDIADGFGLLRAFPISVQARVAVWRAACGLHRAGRLRSHKIGAWSFGRSRRGSLRNCRQAKQTDLLSLDEAEVNNTLPQIALGQYRISPDDRCWAKRFRLASRIPVSAAVSDLAWRAETVPADPVCEVLLLQV